MPKTPHLADHDSAACGFVAHPRETDDAADWDVFKVNAIASRHFPRFPPARINFISTPSLSREGRIAIVTDVGCGAKVFG
jgi:hypothetical protein